MTEGAIEMGPSTSELQQVHKKKLLEENPELTERDAEKLAEEKQYYKPGDSEDE